MLEHSEFVAIVPVQAVVGPKPYESLKVLRNRCDERMRKSILHREIMKPDVLAGNSGVQEGVEEQKGGYQLEERRQLHADLLQIDRFPGSASSAQVGNWRYWSETVVVPECPAKVDILAENHKPLFFPSVVRKGR